ncbi:MAG TPA: ECF-type sigma factor [Lacipirellulaceae bacterium]|jgi:RNA polymerase sigma factor (TIGR02999 family)|nr:ECF-type sigma factor [Lacipirellulaceae bacterium]
MTNVTQILSAIESGDPSAADQLLPLVYAELRRLAAWKLAQEKPGHTWDATALVHEAYLRLIGPADREAQNWDSRRHFFAAASEAMRRILVENARRNRRTRHGGQFRRAEMEDVLPVVPILASNDDILSVHEALDELERLDNLAARVVKLHYFLGVSFAEAAELLGISERTAFRNWSYARAWLYQRLADKSS